MCFSSTQRRHLGDAGHLQAFFDIDAEISGHNVSAQLRTYTTHHGGDLEFEITENLLMMMLDRDHSAGAPSYLIDRPGTAFRFPELYFLPRGLELKTTAMLGKTKFVLCALSDALLDDLEIDQSSIALLRKGGELRSPALRKGLLVLMRELDGALFARSLMVESVGTMLCIELSRLLQEDKPMRASGGLAGWQLRRVKEVVMEGDKRITIAQLAELCGISVRQFVRAFKESTGTTAHAYVEEVRFEQARHQLLHTNRSIKQIAGVLGFRSSSNFSEAFRRVCGSSPTEFRAVARC